MAHTFTSSTVTVSSKVIEDILAELRLLRNEITLLFPQEDLHEYAHPERIKRSYENARKRYPPASV